MIRMGPNRVPRLARSRAFDGERRLDAPGRRAHGRSRPAALALISALAALTGLVGGCGGPGTGTDHPLAGPPRSAAAPAAWPFWPRTVRVHPLTRLVEEADGTTYIEARVEFLDRQGDGTKASGELELALFDERRGQDDRRSIDYWRSPLVDEQGIAANFDPVTRTYLFKLAISPEVFELRPVLYVRHDSTDGRTMLARMELRTEP